MKKNESEVLIIILQTLLYLAAFDMLIIEL